MSNALIDRSRDLKRLRDEGYEVEIRNGFLLVCNVPYLNANREISFGTLVSTLTLAGDRTARPDNHVVQFIGDHPCDIAGAEIPSIKNASVEQKLAEGLIINHTFSNKPPNGYDDYFQKMTRYVEIISAPAKSIDGKITAQTFGVIVSDQGDSVFHYLDTNSSRAEIYQVSEKLMGQKIGIVGVGGTGSYVLDLVAKTPVAEIHLFDEDELLQHNAFRAPGAPSISELEQKPKKADYFQAIYSKMHKNIIPHDCFIDSENTGLLEGLDFVFICMDKGKAKKAIIEKLEEQGTSFVDVGIGIEVVDDRLHGILRTTTSTNKKRNHIREHRLISFVDNVEDDDYLTNIQIADLNSLNASFAVIKWKKLSGYYDDLKKEHNSTYTLNVNMLLSDDF